MDCVICQALPGLPFTVPSFPTAYPRSSPLVICSGCGTPVPANASKYSVYVYVYNEYGTWSNEKPAIGAAAAMSPDDETWQSRVGTSRVWHHFVDRIVESISSASRRTSSLEYDTSFFYCCCLLLWSFACTLKPSDLGHPESLSLGESLTPLLSPPRPCPGKPLD